MEELGTWVFVAGLVLALILGFISGIATGTALTVLVVLGLVVGFMNITEKEVHGFLVAAIALLLVGTVTRVDSLPVIGLELQAALRNIVLFVSPSALVVAIREVFILASSK